MLDGFRTLSKSFVSKLLMALLVLSFAVWGIEDMLIRPDRNATVATVGDVAISMNSYQRALRREMENIRQALGERYSPELAKSLGIEQYVLRSLVNEALLKAESEALGLAPGDADVARRIRSNPAFQDSKGIFDKQAFGRTLAHMGMSEKAYVEKMRQDISSQLIMDTLAAHVPVPDIAVETLHAAREEPRQVTIYTLGAEPAGKIQEPAAGALESYYAEHAREFSAPEYRSVSYVVLKPEHARANIKISEETLLAAYKERIDEFRRPERRTVDQLLYADQAEAKKALALLQSGKPFDQVARSTPILNKNAVTLGKVGKDGILEAAAEAVFSLDAGKFTAPVQSPFGWHIFLVRAIEPPGVASINEVHDLLEKDLRRQAEEEAQVKLANRLEDTLAGGGTLEEAAREFGLAVQELGPFTLAGKAPDGSAVKLPDLEKFLDTAFRTEEKTESPLMHASGGRYYLVRVDKVTPERNRALDEVRALVLAAWQKQEAHRLLAGRAAEAAEAMKDQARRSEAVGRYRLKPAFAGALKRSSDKAGSLPLPAMLKNEIFSLAPGESSAAHPLPSGEYAVAVAGERMRTAAPDKTTLESTRRSLASDMQNELVSEYFAWLERKYPVNINEELLQSAATE